MYQESLHAVILRKPTCCVQSERSAGPLCRINLRDVPTRDGSQGSASGAGHEADEALSRPDGQAGVDAVDAKDGQDAEEDQDRAEHAFGDMH